MTNYHIIRGAALAAMLAGAACTETIELVQEIAIPGPDGPPPGMARIAISRIEAHRDDGVLPREVFNVKLDGSYLIHRDELVGVDTFPAVVDVPIGEHTIELERRGREWAGIPAGGIAASVAVALTERSYNQILVYGASGAEEARVFLDELRGVPEGSYRARVMNLLDHGANLTVLACKTRESCTTITNELAWGEVWEDIVDVEIVASLHADSKHPIPLPHRPEQTLPPPATPGFGSIYAWRATAYDSPASCPVNDECDRATVIANYTLSPHPF